MSLNSARDFTSYMPSYIARFRQHPQFEGDNLNNICFQSVTVAHKKAIYSIGWNEKDKAYILEAGAADGVADGANFHVYKSEKVSPKLLLGEVKVSRVGPFQSKAEGTSKRARFKSGFAVQIHLGKKEDFTLKINRKCLLEGQLELVNDTFKALSEIKPMPPIIAQTTDRRAAPELELLFEGDGIILGILDRRVTQYGIHRIPHSINCSSEEASLMLQGAAHYYRHLLRAGEPDTHGVLPQIKVEFVLLKESPQSEHGIRPLNSSLQSWEVNIVDQGSIKVIAGENYSYGVKITNNSDIDLYPYLFFFDSSDFQIGMYFRLGYLVLFLVPDLVDCTIRL